MMDTKSKKPKKPTTFRVVLTDDDGDLLALGLEGASNASSFTSEARGSLLRLARVFARPDKRCPVCGNAVPRDPLSDPYTDDGLVCDEGCLARRKDPAREKREAEGRAALASDLIDIEIDIEVRVAGPRGNYRAHLHRPKDPTRPDVPKGERVVDVWRDTDWCGQWSWPPEGAIGKRLQGKRVVAREVIAALSAALVTRALVEAQRRARDADKGATP